MPGIEWNVPSSFTSPEGTLDLEDGGTTLNGYIHEAGSCDVGLTVRSTVENIPQGDGDQVHSRFKGGYVMRLSWQLWDDGAIAIGTTRREMYEELMLHLNAVLNDDGRYQWTPSGSGEDRILDGLRLLEWPDPAVVQDSLKRVTVVLDTRFPYALDFTEVDVTVTGSGTVTNDGNVPYYAVIHVPGPFSTFTLTNSDVVDDDGNPLEIVYDDSLPGAVAVASGHYAEITTFGGGKAYLDGSGANLKKGIDITLSEFFPLKVGSNAIAITGAASAIFKTNGAFAL
jgi:phage-related protein